MINNPGNLEGINGLLIFEFGKREYCIDIQIVTEIIKTENVKIFINERNESIVNINNTEYKMIQLHKILGTEEINVSDACRMVFIEIFNKRIAFVVDRITEILTTDRILIETTLDITFTWHKKYIKGFLKYQGRRIILPDLEIISKEINNLANVFEIRYKTGDQFKTY